jgi:5'-deoxynucleotidase YfbR-like HD superfamily hydrolase
VTNRAPYRTAGGRLLDLSLPNPEALDLEDIAHALARLCRFNGAVDEFYSVASHSVYVARRLLEEFPTNRHVARAGLLHDASEALLGDMTSGLKGLFPEYRELERLWDYAVERRFSVVFVGSGLVKNADLRARLAEARDLFTDYPRAELFGGEGDLQPYAAVCRPQTPDEAEVEFMALARELGLFSCAS